MNNQMTYWQLFSILKRWFISRWWDILCDDQWLMDYLNLAMQDLYNEDNSTWRHITEELTWVLTNDWKYYKYNTQLPIFKIQKCYPFIYWNEISFEENSNLQPTLFPIKNWRECKFSWNEIITNTETTKIVVTYLSDYVPATLADKSKLVPIPFRYIPSILKLAFDWAAPINLMASETQTTDFYSHWITRLNKININDSLTDYGDASPWY